MKAILVLWYGWVLVGEWHAKDKKLIDAKVIRRWGTTKGIGELVNGPLPGTVVDTLGTVEIPQKPLIVLPVVRGW